MNFIHKHKGVIYGIIGFAGMTFLILTAGASDCANIGCGQAAVAGTVSLVLVLIGIYGSNSLSQQKGKEDSHE
jgi:hypothetical protein